jgi:hypothetical protein
MKNFCEFRILESLCDFLSVMLLKTAKRIMILPKIQDVSDQEK